MAIKCVKMETSTSEYHPWIKDVCALVPIREQWTVIRKLNVSFSSKQNRYHMCTVLCTRLGGKGQMIRWTFSSALFHGSA